MTPSRSPDMYLAFLEALLQKAGEMATNFSEGLSISIKESDPNQVVTAVDIAIGCELKRQIHERFPRDSIIDEESEAMCGISPVTWVIDPIDGTSNFAAGSPLFGIMVGVLEYERPVAGGVILPALSEIYVAASEQGAYCNGGELYLKAEGDLSDQLIACGIDFNPSEIARDCEMVANVASRCRGVRMSNSVFDLMMVAKGVYGASLHRNNHIWDCVAPQLIIQEAGGVFSEMNGDPLDYLNPLARSTKVYSILACAPAFHEAVVDMVQV